MGMKRNEFGDMEPTGQDLAGQVLDCLTAYGPLEAGQVAIELGTDWRRTVAAVASLRREGRVATVDGACVAVVEQAA